MAQFLGCGARLACDDVLATRSYYRDILGFKGDWDWTWGEPPDHAGVSRGRTRILLFQPEDDRARRFEGTEVTIYVRGLAEVYAEHIASGADIVQEMGERAWGTIDYTVRDPNGVFLVFGEAPDTF